MSYLLGTFHFIFQFTNFLFSSVMNCVNPPLSCFYLCIVLFLEILFGSFSTIVFFSIVSYSMGFILLDFSLSLFWGNILNISILKYFQYCFVTYTVICILQYIVFADSLSCGGSFLLIVCIFDCELISSRTWLLWEAYMLLVMGEA